ncbi:MAG: CorA family divalent cation transporter, partial [Bacteroidota bacterium]
LLDLIVDGAFATVERLGDATEALEEAVLGDPGPGVRSAIAGLRREVLVVRRAVRPLRDVITELTREEDGFFESHTHLFLRDVHDHAIQAGDALEILRDVITGLSDLYISAVSMRQNEVMKTLTVVGALFLPLTFLTSLYGMNFADMPELHYPHAYPVFLIILLILAGGTIAAFRIKRWI